MLQDLRQNPCLSADALADYIENRLSSEDRAALEGHLAGCRMCHDAVEGIRTCASVREFRRSHDSIRERLRASVEAVTPDR